MAGYIRQSSFSDGDTITAALFNNEYNQLLNAFSNTTGHAHDGTTAEGPVIGLIGDAGETSPNNKVLIDTTNNFIEFYVEVSSAPVQQLYISDGAIIPVTDSDVDLGTTSLRFKDTYTDTVTTTGNVSVGGNLTVTGTTTFNGGTITMGDAATDNVVFGADIDSHIIPDDDDTYDLGSSTQQWRNLYVDGTANLDTVSIEGDATFADNAKAIFGAGSDLQIYHDGSNSYITDSGTGNLKIGGANVEITTAGGTKYFQGAANIARLYHTGNEKLATTTTGIEVTGTAVTDGLTSSGDLVVDDGTRSLTYDVSAGELNHAGSNFYINKTNGVDVSIGNDDFYVDMSTSRVGIGTTSPQKLLHVSDLSGSAQIMISSSDSGVASLQFSDAVGGSVARGYIEYDNSTNHLALGTGALERLRIDSSGNVGIGTNAPNTYSGYTTLTINNATSGGIIDFEANGTLTGEIYSDSTGLGLIAPQADDDIFFKGNDGGSTITALTLDMSDAGTAIFNHNIKLGDAGVFIGSGNNLRLEHDGTDSFVTNYTGDLKFTQTVDDKDITFDCDDGSGGTARYITIDGSAALTQFDKHTKHADAIRADFGNASDLQIYHDGSNSYIQDTGTGNLRIRGTNLRIEVLLLLITLFFVQKVVQ